jgi:hypothetical protein
MRIRAVLAAALVAILIGTPNVYASKAPSSGLKKSETRQNLKSDNKWRTLKFDGNNAWELNGKRTLWSAQAHVYCDVAPKYIKMRLARVKPDGTKDTTGTTTWSAIATTKWQGTFLWETKSKYPMIVQIKVNGGKGCYSPIREFKYWQPEVMPDVVPIVTMKVPQLSDLP